MKKVLIATIFISVLAVGVFSQTTEFTYQGSLKNSGTPANGNFDFEFKLFDLVSAGTQAGSTVQRLNVAVANGAFTVSLDFGAVNLPGADRYLDIAVRTAGGGAFAPLSPRQKVTSAPYSVKSLSSTTATTATNATQLGGVAASQYVVTTDPRMTDSRSPTAGSTNYVQNQNAAPQSSSNFNISGTGTANIVGATTQFNLNGNRILSSPVNNLFVGRQTGQSNTTGDSNSFFGTTAGSNNTSGGNNSFFGFLAGNTTNIGNGNAFFGYSAGRSNTTGGVNSFYGFNAGEFNTTANFNSFFGYNAGQNTTGANNSFFGASAGQTNTTGSNNTVFGNGAGLLSNNLTNASAVGSMAAVGASNSLILGSINGVNGATVDTNVGIGTAAPSGRLHVAGGTAWTNANWLGSVKLNNGTAMGWSGNSGGRHYGIGQTNGGLYFFNTADDFGGVGANAFTLLTLTDDFRVGISTDAPDQALSVNGNASKSQGGTTWAVFSDERLKNVHGNFTHGLSTLMQLQPIRYQYKADNPLGLKSDSESVGFSAQQVQRVLPEAVTTSKDGYLQLSSDPIIWTMLNAVKEQQVQIELQQKIIDSQQNEAAIQKVANQNLQSQVDELKRAVCALTPGGGICKAKEK